MFAAFFQYFVHTFALSKFFYLFYDTLFFASRDGSKICKNAKKPVRKNSPITFFFWQWKNDRLFLGNHIVTEKRWERTNEHQSDCNNHLRLRSRSQERVRQALGFQNIKTSDGKVEFTGDESDIVKANLWLRCAGRVREKDHLYCRYLYGAIRPDEVALPWGRLLIPEDGKFTVVGKSVKSTLFSVSDCQAIVKKAVVEKLKEKYKTDWFDETGASYTIQVGILKDVVTLAIDTSGSGLHMRGYRASALDAPLKGIPDSPWCSSATGERIVSC